MSNNQFTAALIASEFWKHKTLDEMNHEEWEAICDGCAKCCLHKFIDDESMENETQFEVADSLREGESLVFTSIACHLMHTKTCQCKDYAARTKRVPTCVTLTKENLQDVFFMPNSCSYRRLQEGRGLASWHPLLNNGKKSKMHELGISARGKTVNESDINVEDFEDYIAQWPELDVD